MLHPPPEVKQSVPCHGGQREILLPHGTLKAGKPANGVGIINRSWPNGTAAHGTHSMGHRPRHVACTPWASVPECPRGIVFQACFLGNIFPGCPRSVPEVPQVSPKCPLRFIVVGAASLASLSHLGTCHARPESSPWRRPVADTFSYRVVCLPCVHGGKLLEGQGRVFLLLDCGGLIEAAMWILALRSGPRTSRSPGRSRRGACHPPVGAAGWRSSPHRLHSDLECHPARNVNRCSEFLGLSLTWEDRLVHGRGRAVQQRRAVRVRHVAD